MIAFVEQLQEHWTDRRSAVVVTGGSAEIDRLLLELDICGDRPVNVSGNNLALALWGEELQAYLRLRNDLCLNKTEGNGSEIEQTPLSVESHAG